MKNRFNHNGDWGDGVREGCCIAERLFKQEVPTHQAHALCVTGSEISSSFVPLVHHPQKKVEYTQLPFPPPPDCPSTTL